MQRVLLNTEPAFSLPLPSLKLLAAVQATLNILLFQPLNAGIMGVFLYPWLGSIFCLYLA